MRVRVVAISDPKRNPPRHYRQNRSLNVQAGELIDNRVIPLSSDTFRQGLITEQRKITERGKNRKLIKRKNDMGHERTGKRKRNIQLLTIIDGCDLYELHCEQFSTVKFSLFQQQ